MAAIAPLRRVCDRFANEIVLAHCGGIEAPAWALEALEQLPAIMTSARQRDGALERASVDFVETVALRCRVGEIFDGMVLSHSRNGAKVQLHDPAVLAPIREQPEVGEMVRLRLDSVDSKKRRVEFSVVL